MEDGKQPWEQRRLQSSSAGFQVLPPTVPKLCTLSNNVPKISPARYPMLNVNNLTQSVLKLTNFTQPVPSEAGGPHFLPCPLPIRPLEIEFRLLLVGIHEIVLEVTVDRFL
jgi:hypothetical protein